MMAQHLDQAEDRETDQDHILDHRQADLGARRDADTHDRDHKHGQGDAGSDADIRPRAAGARGEHGEDRRPDDFDPGDRPDDVTGDHQPSGQEAEVGVDRPANPLERRAAVGVPHVQPPVGVGDDKHRNRGEDDDRPAAVGGRRGQRGQRQPDRHRRGGRRHPDDSVLRYPDRIRLEPGRRDQRASRDGSCELIRH